MEEKDIPKNAVYVSLPTPCEELVYLHASK